MCRVPIGVVFGLGSVVLTAIVTEVYGHRCLAHHAYRVHPAMALVLDTYFRVIVGTDPESWAAVHRLHHRYADTPLDPHSPQQRGPLMILVGSPYLFNVARKQLPNDNPPRWRAWVLRILLIAFFVSMIGWVQEGIALVVHLVGYMGIMGMVNTVGHLHGRKPHPEAVGYDLAWLAIPLLGHGYHNSHHAHPAAPRTGRLDPIWPLLRAGAAIGLIEVGGRRDRARTGCCEAGA